jgi:hypothetical protein
MYVCIHVHVCVCVCVFCVFEGEGVKEEEDLERIKTGIIGMFHRKETYYSGKRDLVQRQKRPGADQDWHHQQAEALAECRAPDEVQDSSGASLVGWFS